MKKAIIIFTLSLITSIQLNAQTVVETVSSGTSGDAILKIEADTDNNNEADNPRIELKQDGGLSGAYIGFNADWGGVAPDNLFRIGTRYSGVDNFTRFIINPQNGHVGIGTTNPAAKLDIFGSNSNSTNLILSANYVDKFRWRFNTIDRGNAIDMDITASDGSDVQEVVLKLSRSSSTRPEFQLYNNAIVANNGSVGIGTASPTEKLHVSGNILANQMLLNDPNTTTDWNTLWQSGFYQSYNATNAPEANAWFWGLNMNHSSNHANYRYSGQIAIKNSTTNPVMYFRSTNSDGVGNWTKILHSLGDQTINGNLGIGTTDTKGFKLGVQGKIAAEEVKVAAYTNWADFVFENNYNLPTLKEVEKHIKDKGHLRDIPSAEEVKKDGFFLGEMDSKLLQKIEELTLYTIEQEKEISTLQKKSSKVDKLEKELQNQKDRLQKIESILNSIKE